MRREIRSATYQNARSAIEAFEQACIDLANWSDGEREAMGEILEPRPFRHPIFAMTSTRWRAYGGRYRFSVTRNGLTGAFTILINSGTTVDHFPDGDTVSVLLSGRERLKTIEAAKTVAMSVLKYGQMLWVYTDGRVDGFVNHRGVFTPQ
jgi:hypothetical protein